MSCMGRNIRARARLFSPVIYEKIARLASNFEMLNSDRSRSAIRSRIPFIGGSRAFASAPHRITDAAPTSVPPDPPRNFGACDFMEDSCNARPAIFRRRAPSRRSTLRRTVQICFFMVPSLGEGASLRQAPLPFALGSNLLIARRIAIAAVKVAIHAIRAP